MKKQMFYSKRIYFFFLLLHFVNLVNGQRMNLDSIVVLYNYVKYNTYLISDIYTYKYDENGRNISETDYTLNADPSDFGGQQPPLDEKLKSNFSYDNNGKISSILSRRNYITYNENNVFGYDIHGNLILKDDYEKNGSDWIISNSDRYSYDINSRLQSQVTYYNGYPVTKHDFKYDNRNLLQTDFKYVMPMNDTNWQTNDKLSYIYDENGKIKSISDSGWVYYSPTTDSSYSTWISTKDYTFDSNGDYLGYLDYYYYFRWKYIDVQRQELNINKLYLASDINWPYNPVVDIKPKYMIESYNVDKIEDYVKHPLDWRNFLKYNFYYSPNNISGIKEVKKQIISVYPNPASGIINITSNQTRIKRIDAFDITGKLLYTFPNENNLSNIQINLSPLNSGIYIIQTETEDGQISNNKIVLSSGF